jgi:hypothetical protein
MKTSTMLNTSSSETTVFKSRSNFYLFSAVAALLVTIAGFSLTYLKPLAGGTFTGRSLLHIHGAMYFGWLLLFICQPALVKTNHVAIHRKLGMAGFLLAAGMVIVGVTVAVTGARLHSPTLLVGGLQPKQFLIVPLTDMILFTTFLSFSLANLKRPEAHKRLMLLATVSLLPAAFGRLAPMLGTSNPIIILAMQEVILFAGMIYDAIARKKIHPVYYWGGGLMVIIHLVRFPIGGSAWWSAVAEWIVG